MVELTIEQQLYLLYARAYVDAELGTVTKSTVKSYLPKKWRGNSERIYDALQKHQLIKQTGRGRLALTEEGEQELIQNLSTTDYRFDSVKGPKVLNALLLCLKNAADSSHSSQGSQEMSFATFHQNFKSLYFEQRKQQSLQGVVAITEQEISEIFMDKYSVSRDSFQKNFKALRDKGEISVIEGGEGQLIEWVE